MSCARAEHVALAVETEEGSRVVLAGGVGFAVTLSLWFTPAAYCLISRRAEVTA